MTTSHLRVTRAAATALVGLLAIAACGGGTSSSAGGASASASATTSASASGGGSGTPTASDVGVTATSVLIGSHQPLTGPAAPGYSEIAPAAKAYFDFINAAGGINGRKINYTFLDDGYNPVKTATVVRQLVLQDKVFAVFNGLGTPTHSAVADFLNSAKVPDLFVASGCACWNEPQTRPYTFGWQPDYTIEGKILGQYVKQHFAGKKVGYLLQNDDFGKDGAKGLDLYVPSSSVVSRQYYTSGTTDLTAQVSSLKSAGAEVVVSFTVPIYTAIAKLTGLKLGYNPQLVVSNVGSDPKTLQALVAYVGKGAAPSSVIDGIVSDTYLPALSDTTNSWVALFKKIHDGDPTVSKLPFDGNVEYGMASAFTFAQALAKAGANPTRASIVAAIEAGGFTGPGLVPFRFSSSDHSGYNGVQIATLTNGAATTTGSILTTDDGSGPITPYTTAQPTAPADGRPTS